MIAEPGSIEALKAELAAAARISDLMERAIEVVGVIEGLAADVTHPVIVGGMAVYFALHDDAFLTADIDVVMEVPDRLRCRLEQVGFVEHSDGRHWELPGTDVFVEAPAAMLDPDARTVEVQTRSGRVVSVLSAVDVLLDRLDEFQATGSVFVGQQALALVRHVDESYGDLELRATRRRVGVVLERMSRLADEIHGDRRAAPESDEFHEIARLSLEAEYHPRQ